jgi:hypothetical protein
MPSMLPAGWLIALLQNVMQVTIVSAHRTPQRLESYARSAAGRGLKVGQRLRRRTPCQLVGCSLLAGSALQQMEHGSYSGSASSSMPLGAAAQINAWSLAQLSLRRIYI